MHQRLEFPLYLESCKPNPEPHKEEIQDFRFTNYYPREESLKTHINKIETEWQHIESETTRKMDELANSFLRPEKGKTKINIYPKKNTIDLKKHLARKMEKINRKTDKAIVFLAKKLLKPDEDVGAGNESSVSDE